VDLHHYLTSSKTRALFWISHAISDKNLRGLGKLPSIILDEKNNINIAPIFQSVHQNMSFLSIIGCEAQGIIDKYKKQGHFKLNPNLVIQSFSEKISLTKGIRTSLNEANKILGTNDNPSWNHNHGSAIRYRNNNRLEIKAKDELLSISESIPMLKNQGFVLNILPSVNQLMPAQMIVGKTFLGLLLPGDKLQKFIIPSNLLKKRIKLLVKTGSTRTATYSSSKIGELEIVRSPEIMDIDFYKNSNGELEGVDTNIYYLTYKFL